MLASRWTWLSGIFAAAAAGYIAYIGVELFRSASAGLQHLANNWRDLTGPTPSASPMHLWLSSGGLVLQLALIGIAIVVLGTRSLRATASILQGRGEDDHARSNQEPGATRPAAG